MSAATATTSTTKLAAGAVSSEPVFVTRIGDAAAQVTALAPALPTADCGTPPAPCYQGFEIVAGEPLLLFKARPTTLTMPPAQTLQAGGDAVAFDLKQWIDDPDSDSLTFTAESANPSVATVAVRGDALTITPGEDEGTAIITITATDGDGYTATLTLTVIVDPPMHGLLHGWRLPELIESGRK